MREPLIQEISRSLLYGPEMMLFHAAFVAWIVIFVIHLRKGTSRHWSSKVLMSLTIFTGMLAPFHYSLRVLVVNRMLASSGVVDPMSWADLQANLTLGCVIMGLTSMVFLALSTWAWIIPRSAADRPT